MESRELGFNIRALIYAGFIPLDGQPPTKRQIAWSVVTMVQFLMLYLLVFVHQAMSEFSMPMAITLVNEIVLVLQTTFRRFYFTFNVNDMAGLVERLDELPQSESNEFNVLEGGMRAQTSRRLRSFSSLVLGFNGVVVLAVIGVAISGSVLYDSCSDTCNTSSSLLVNMWWPGDVEATPTFYILSAWQFASVLTTFSTVATTDAFVCSLMLAAAERSSLLSRAAPQALLPGPRNQFTPHFRAWVKYHQHYLKTVTQLNTVMGPVVFMTYVVAGVNIISLSYLSVKMNDLRLVVLCMSVLVVVLVQLFTFAYAGQQILNKSEELARSTLCAAQVGKGGLQDGPSRSALLVLVTRLSGGAKPEEINGLGYFAVSMEFFTKVLSASVSYLLVLLQLQPQSL